MASVAPTIRRAVVPAESAAQVAAELRARLAPVAGEVVLVFVTSRLDPVAVAAALARALAPARVVGCTSVREVAGASVAGTAIGLVFGPPAFRIGVGVAARLAGGPLGAGRAAVVAAAADLGMTVDQLTSQRHVAIALVDGHSTAAEGFCLGSGAAAPRIGMVGGVSSDDRAGAPHAAVFADGLSLQDAGVVIMLETDRPFAALLCEHMVPTQERVVVTGADPSRRRVSELDGFPAAPRYLQLVRGQGADGPLTAALAAEFPFAMYVDGRPYVRSIRDIDGDELVMAAAVDLGAVLRIMRPSDLVARTAAALADAHAQVGPLELVLAFSCTARNLEAERKRTRDALDRVYADAPVFGFDSFGEQFGPLLVNHTLVALAIGAEAAP
ncbi:MAG: FIST C-terminal domain-containing protein [Myxococcales bacterium]|nr:FIST C-terminal domain-containing protein [Myxococcales bacterium]